MAVIMFWAGIIHWLLSVGKNNIWKEGGYGKYKSAFGTELREEPLNVSF